MTDDIEKGQTNRFFEKINVFPYSIKKENDLLKQYIKEEYEKKIIVNSIHFQEFDRIRRKYEIDIIELKKKNEASLEAILKLAREKEERKKDIEKNNYTKEYFEKQIDSLLLLVNQLQKVNKKNIDTITNLQKQIRNANAFKNKLFSRIYLKNQKLLDKKEINKNLLLQLQAEKNVNIALLEEKNNLQNNFDKISAKLQKYEERFGNLLTEDDYNIICCENKVI